MVRIAALGAEEAGAKVTIIDLCDYPMPLYDADLEAEKGLPEQAAKLKKLMQASDGFLISSPEYNSGYSAVLKNTIDWISRMSDKNEVPLSAFAGKTASIMAAAPGSLGGLRGLYQLRALLMNINVKVLPNMKAVSYAEKEFSEDGKLEKPELEKTIKNLGKETVEAIQL